MPKIDRAADAARLKLLAPVPATLHPAAVYLASLSEGSRATMRHALDAIASLLTGGECDALTLDWSKLRYQHTAAVRASLVQRFATAWSAGDRGDPKCNCSPQLKKPPQEKQCLKCS